MIIMANANKKVVASPNRNSRKPKSSTTKKQTARKPIANKSIKANKHDVKQDALAKKISSLRLETEKKLASLKKELHKKLEDVKHLHYEKGYENALKLLAQKEQTVEKAIKKIKTKIENAFAKKLNTKKSFNKKKTSTKVNKK